MLSRIIVLVWKFCWSYFFLFIWSLYIQYIRSKVWHIISIIYRNFYQNASLHTLFTVYHSLAIPHCLSLWDPPTSHTNSEIIESTQEFALMICSHNWNSGYPFLLSAYNISSISTCYSIFKLCLVYKIINNLLYFLPVIDPKSRPIHASRCYDSHVLVLYLVHQLYKIHLFYLPSLSL